MDITVLGLLLCVCTVANFIFPPAFACNLNLMVNLYPDQPSKRVQVNGKADVECCYKPEANGENVPRQIWVMLSQRNGNVTHPEPVNPGPQVIMRNSTKMDGSVCHQLNLTNTQLNDTGFYQCLFIHGQSCRYSHGTYLQVYTPMRRTLDISESWKNSIITMEGVLLLFAVLIPGICQLGKTKRLTQLNRKKQREEENIYEGLNLDDCNSTYHQIQRTNRHGPYQDVANTGEDDIQFEKP